LEQLLKGCIPDIHDDAKPDPSSTRRKRIKKSIAVNDETPGVSEPDASGLPSDLDTFLLPSDPDTSVFPSEPDVGTSGAEGLSDAPTSNMSDGLPLEGKPYVLYREGKF
jgi:hypothetical protein